jgi:hypothetical protein
MREKGTFVATASKKPLGRLLRGMGAIRRGVGIHPRGDRNACALPLFILKAVQRELPGTFLPGARFTVKSMRLTMKKFVERYNRVVIATGDRGMQTLVDVSIIEQRGISGFCIRLGLANTSRN